jgi:hypothetical protein
VIGTRASPKLILEVPVLRRNVEGVLRMPRRPWSEDDVAKLRSMAGRLTTKEIAAELGRTPQATMVEASKLKISLSTRPNKARAASIQNGYLARRDLLD